MVPSCRAGAVSTGVGSQSPGWHHADRSRPNPPRPPLPPQPYVKNKKDGVAGVDIRVPSPLPPEHSRRFSFEPPLAHHEWWHRNRRFGKRRGGRFSQHLARVLPQSIPRSTSSSSSLQTVSHYKFSICFRSSCRCSVGSFRGTDVRVRRGP